MNSMAFLIFQRQPLLEYRGCEHPWDHGFNSHSRNIRYA